MKFIKDILNRIGSKRRENVVNRDVVYSDPPGTYRDEQGTLRFYGSNERVVKTRGK